MKSKERMVGVVGWLRWITSRGQTDEEGSTDQLSRE